MFAQDSTLFSLSPFTAYFYIQTGSKGHNVQLKSGHAYTIKFQEPGCLPGKILLDNSHFVREYVLVNKSRLFLHFTNVFLETVVTIATLGLTWKKNLKNWPLKVNRILLKIVITVLKRVVCYNTGPSWNEFWELSLQPRYCCHHEVSLVWSMIKLKISCILIFPR